MSEAKPFASLSSGLLARKGGAKPAMRRPNIQVTPNHGSENGQDDLGWNDMGYDVDPDISNEAPAEKPLFNPLAKAVETPKPEVKQQQERIAAQLQAKPNEEDSDSSPASLHNIDNKPVALHPTVNNQSVADDSGDTQSDISPTSLNNVNKQISKPAANLHKPAVKKSNIKKTVTKKSKAAFTLRLDPERHLKLRLACAINNISAQKFVTEALDQKLNEMEEINQLSGQIAEKTS